MTNSFSHGWVRGILKTTLALTWVCAVAGTLSANPAWADKCPDPKNELEQQVAELQAVVSPGAFTPVGLAGFGRVWHDPSGMIWGEVIKNADGTDRRFTQPQAIRFCESIGARLPSREDFIALRKYIDTSETGPYVETLPELTYTVRDEAHGRNFWTSTYVTDFYDTPSTEFAYYVDGRTGVVRNYYSEGRGSANMSVRCVAGRD